MSDKRRRRRRASGESSEEEEEDSASGVIFKLFFLREIARIFYNVRKIDLSILGVLLHLCKKNYGLH